MAEPSHRSTTFQTPRAPVDVGRAADLLTSGDLEVTPAGTDGNSDRSAHSDTPPPAVSANNGSRPRRARHAKVTGDESPTVAFPPLTPTATGSESPTTHPADTSAPDTTTGDTADTVADSWQILSPADDDTRAPAPEDVAHTQDAATPEDTDAADSARPEAVPAAPPPATVAAADGRTDDSATAATAVPSGAERAPAAPAESRSENADLTVAPSIPAAIDVVGLHKRFGDNVAVESVSFSVAKGSILALLGPNGAGKTTTVNMLCTLLKPDGGTATVAGHDVVSDAAGVRRSIMLTGQFAALDEALSGRDNLILFGRLMGLSKSAARTRADELLTSFDLTRAAGRRVGEYSGGMRRRIDIACGLVTQPEVVFLDEPTTGLDPRSRQEVWKLVESLRDQGVTTLLTTQYLEEADTLSDHIVVIDRGRVIASGTADELKSATGASHYDVTPAAPEDLPRLISCLDDLLTDAPVGEDADDAAPNSVAVPAPDGADTLVEIVHRTTGAGIRLSDVALRRPSLDEVFLALTDPGAATPASSPKPADEPA
ncbi:ATP-binding cassette domain-containing protein [Gordonia mangrovi]|uniref:ATP-binding cassette domain-containing protein n=1 Tax=Gordonia mangrovi TaxID=2665643 RepID=UPI001F3CEE5A|nr:ATP-binding cassette domain-containing protein [Gordonia mangrovi]UVF78906.1 ATP-binding cassette domain-containing protein [Gordonia mangrovi]